MGLISCDCDEKEEAEKKEHQSKVGWKQSFNIKSISSFYKKYFELERGPAWTMQCYVKDESQCVNVKCRWHDSARAECPCFSGD